MFTLPARRFFAFSALKLAEMPSMPYIRRVPLLRQQSPAASL
jgi:hypothetical protein